MIREKIKKNTVFVGLSGGVDSAVSAAILQKEGYKVVGVFIKTWHPEFLECNEEEERRDAMRVAAHLDIPFLTLDLEDVYKREVADYMISEYRAGRTPNPDVMCNKEVKFGAFLRYALSKGADYVATGHYARSLKEKSFFLAKGKDPSKDQSYFLWTLKQEALQHILFPAGGFKKAEVRKLARKFKLPVAEKKDSQGICFLGAIDLKEFLKHYIKEKKGDVIVVPSEAEGNKKSTVIGYHSGAVFHTLGERHGFTITRKSPNESPYYIIGKDLKKNLLIVSHNKNISNSSAKAGYELENANWIAETPDPKKKYAAQIRYHGELLPCFVEATSKSRAMVIFHKPVLVASGQSVVVYDKDICMGGGIVS